MRTNPILESGSRNLCGVTIRQEAKTQFLNLSDLQRAFDVARMDNDWSERRFSEVLSYTDNRERIYYLLKKHEIITTSLNVFIADTEKHGITKILKRYGAYATKGARHTKSVWCNPYIWVLVAMEMNPMLYGEVITWLTDRLTANRMEAGEMYKQLSNAAAKLNGVDFSKLSRALNIIVFGRHENGIRNKGTEQQLEELHRLEQNLTYSIEAGFIRSFEDLMSHLRSIWQKKNQQRSVLS
ncbi:hypothetical protein DYBT9623_00703 [Dyadobacter sp. CECT 9623]|uniref:KilA-N domain-containing protein n=1 Tax=Dyadobacter linearis TaxID=2823330 RepID=A0ABM8UKH2_9BACT|nr:hypothetical protein [Dyadobacter sp. CECT 9623]CAG5067975.1 hypothetical protein DYBT9623_00703 [Dyadobacter sp. CECT 9623]